MKPRITVFFLFLFLLTAVGFSEERKSDGTAPDLIRGFSILSDEELKDGWVLLFDGKTFFGWEAISVVNKRPLGVPDPKITIKDGKMSIDTEIPIMIKTPISPVFPWSIEIKYRTDGDFRGSAYAAIPNLPHSSLMLKSAEIPLTESSATKTVRLDVPDNQSVLVDGKEVSPENQIQEKCLLLLIHCGTIHIESIRYCQKKTSVFNGNDLTAWKIRGDAKAEVLDGTIHLSGGSGDLESEFTLTNGVAGFEFKENVTPCNSGFFFRSIPESAMDGYECQMNNAPPEADRGKFLGNDTGSIFRRSAARRVIPDPSDWTAVTLMADGAFFRTWVNGIPTLLWTDERGTDENPRKGLRLEGGTLQFQGHDPATDLLIRRVGVAFADSNEEESLPDLEIKTGLSGENEGFLPFQSRMEQLKTSGIDLTDFHIHLRGGMTPEKALQRQEETGIQSGVLENAGRDWPLSDNEKLKNFIDETEKTAFSDDPSHKSLLIGIQVNDRDWFEVIDPELLKRLDFVLADTMIMGEDSEGKPQKLWLLPADYQVDLGSWMEEYMNHYRQILDEPITILANPTYLPLFAEEHYDELWTDERMDEVIDKAVEKGIAFEVQAESPFPKDRFIQKVLEKGGKISFGTNNFDSILKKLDRWEEVFEKFDLQKERILSREDVMNKDK